MSDSVQGSEARKSHPSSEDTAAEAMLNQRATFLLAELEHFEQSLLQNEQLGEGRFRFFLTLITATIAGLVALHTAKGEIVDRQAALPLIVNIALIVLFIFGVLTYLRMLHRDRVSEGYKEDLKYIRRLLRDEVGLTPHYEVPFPPDASNAEDDACNAEKKWYSPTGDWGETLRAGYTQTVGAVCVALASMCVFYNLRGFWDAWWIEVKSVVGISWLIIFVVLCRFVSYYAVISRDKAKCNAKKLREKAEEQEAERIDKDKRKKA